MSIGMPRKVWDRAIERGAHNDCLLGGPDSSCRDCYWIIMDAFDDFYGHLPMGERAPVTRAILQDLEAERGGA